MDLRLFKCQGRCLFRRRGKERGSILVVILWALFFLAALAVAIYAYVWPLVNFGRKLKNDTEMHYLAKAGVKRAIWEIKKDKINLYSTLKDTWSNNEDAFKERKVGEDGFFSVRYKISDPSEDAEVRYGLVDEERKININTSSNLVLKDFFERVGKLSSQDSADIAASIIDWRDENDVPESGGAENDYYSTLGYPCKNKAFEVLEELLFVKGITPEVFDKIKDKITIYGTGVVNINTAETLVLEALGLTESLAEKIIHFRKGDDGKEATDDDGIFEAVGTIEQTLTDKESLSREELSQLSNLIAEGLLSVRSDHFRGESFGELTAEKSTKEIIFVFNRSGVVEYWKEN